MRGAPMTRKRMVVVAAAAVAGGLAVWGLLVPGADVPSGPLVRPSGPGPVAVEAGREPFLGFCGDCHGNEGQGSVKGPPLIHILYEPNHHADGAFILAARRGSPQHHWDFGPMAPVPGVSDADLFAIIAYVRSLQRTAGIF